MFLVVKLTMLNSESKDFVRLHHLPLNTVLTDHISATFPLSASASN